ncbi:30S ribosomal protein S7 [Candidatus Methylacidiphilum infernorum]|uniref:Small ribosomal subunit protein uS7 n=1 Tax=Candidatus Methylacidiphilum infernorum TaxID=511746 RepID=A0ABX7PV30_9BACT|nr:30S ribosomal protein S7 [Candidatus Methylacidiphilum infernorum]QSR86508.1 30S ribosomal protein S7 [Candidatus Methylacidiphilum infernorum]
MRRRRAERRELEPDPKYGSELITKLVNTVMRRGKKSVARRIVYEAIEELNQDNKEGDPVEIVRKAVENVKPKLEVKSRRVGGATYQVPVEVNPHRQVSLALRWIVHFANSRKGVPMAKALCSELMDAANGTGSSIKKRDEVHKMAQANRAFAHLRF